MLVRSDIPITKCFNLTDVLLYCAVLEALKQAQYELSTTTTTTTVIVIIIIIIITVVVVTIIVYSFESHFELFHFKRLVIPFLGKTSRSLLALPAFC